MVLEYLSLIEFNLSLLQQRIIFVLTILVSKTEDTSNYSDNRYAKIDRAVTLFKVKLEKSYIKL